MADELLVEVRDGDIVVTMPGEGGTQPADTASARRSFAECHLSSPPEDYQGRGMFHVKAMMTDGNHLSPTGGLGAYHAIMLGQLRCPSAWALFEAVRWGRKPNAKSLCADAAEGGPDVVMHENFSRRHSLGYAR